MELCYGCMEYMTHHHCDCGFDEETYAIPSHHLKPGTLLHDRYLIGVGISEGEMGITYVARDTILDVKLAVKEFYMAGINNRDISKSDIVCINNFEVLNSFENYRKKFLEEAKVLARFAKEPGIVGIQDYFEDNGTAYIVMEWLPNGSLQEVIDREGKLFWKDAIEWMLPICDAIELLHNEKILHRDVCPEHILLTSRKQLELIDFSLARKFDEIDESEIPAVMRTGFTPEEQYNQLHPQGTYSDVYALSATLYYCISGIVPQSSVKRVIKDEVKPLNLLVNNCFKDVSDIIMKGMSIDMDYRYKTVHEFKTALKGILVKHSDAMYSKSNDKEVIVVKDEKKELLKVSVKERFVMRNIFKKHMILENIEFNVNEKEMVMILGSSGSGKSTLINAIMGYEKANKGTILFDNQDLYKDYNKLKNMIGYVPQQDLMREDDIVYNTLENAAKMRLIKESEKFRNDRIQYVLTLLGLERQKAQLVRKLSGGQRKRLSIALELIADPTLFFLDEPDSGLDGVMARNLMKNLRTIADDNKIVMVITHTPDRVMDLFDKIVVLGKSNTTNCGELCFYGTMKEALAFFDVSTIEGIIHRISRLDEGGEARCDEFVAKFKQLREENND